MADGVPALAAPPAPPSVEAADAQPTGAAPAERAPAEGPPTEAAPAPAPVEGAPVDPQAPQAAPRCPAAEKENCRPTADDREEFSRLRITARQVDPLLWSQEIRGKHRLVVPLSRLGPLRAKQQSQDRVVIAVLYESRPAEKLANGQLFSCWRLTDLGEPKPRCLDVRLRSEAFNHWRTRQPAASVTRGSIFAVMNPALMEEAGPGKPAVVDVLRAAQLMKIGECPSLGLCEMRRCSLPCNADRAERFCNHHLSLAYADKDHRIIANGGLQSKDRPVQKRTKALQPLPPPEPEEAAEGRAEDAKQARIAELALSLDGRRVHHSRAKDNYVNSIAHGKVSGDASGTRTLSCSSSNVPVLGRGLSDDRAFDLDIELVSSGEKRKAERLMEERAERLEQAPEPAERIPAALAPCGGPQGGAKRARNAAGEGGAARERSLGELMQALTHRRAARRVGTAAERASAGGGAAALSQRWRAAAEEASREAAGAGAAGAEAAAAGGAGPGLGGGAVAAGAGGAVGAPPAPEATGEQSAQ
ncbi:unnamed protein product [Prorocentrum cordatum]|uniref:MCM10 OB-fold domain-containing protein n=1 Tax=Prorocentrum cordatum TaxID=2364126 RepID=A0ABN9TWM3_9DINO|nr:unnamed protein product [Polarella glacialis]